METEKMTIHRALAELKLLDSKIEKKISNIEPSGIIQNGKLVNQIEKREDFEKKAQSDFDSIADLITRKSRIKSAITKANSQTPVTVAEVEMVIADAINYKTTIKLKKMLIDKLDSSFRNTLSNHEQNNAQVDTNALKLAEAALGKDNVKIGEGDAVAITEPYIEKNKWDIVDPLGIVKLSEGLTDDVDAFETEIDAVLSEINAVTLIEI